MMGVVLMAVDAQASAFQGPLRVGADNPRYFTDDSGRAVYLTGSHTWATLQERAGQDTPPFDYDGYLDFMQANNHNLLRLWTWEHAAWMQFTDQMIRYWPNRYARTGPGIALDGLPGFDVTRFDEQYFARLRARVEAAGRRGIYVMVMLFQGFSIEQKGTQGVDPARGNPWDGHPFNARNNINGIDGDLNGDGEGQEVHTLASPEITALQDAYVRKVIDTLNDLDYVLWEISNESHAGSTAWQYHMIDLIHEYERGKPVQHPVAMTFQYAGGTNADLFASAAEAISPSSAGGYELDPPAADGSKVILADTDHICALRGDRAWVWKSFCRGLNPIFMDPYRDVRVGHRYDPGFDDVRRNMGHTLAYARRIDLVRMVPRGELCSSGYCLADAGREYLVYSPEPTQVTIDLTDAQVPLRVEWFDPAQGRAVPGDDVSAGRRVHFASPFVGDFVLYLCAGATR
jgi:hypothetical protein